MSGSAVALDNLSFRYKGEDRGSLAIAQLRIEAGEKVALIGASGAGKSTLLRLLDGRLRGFRGQPKADEEALIDAMVRLSQFAAHHADRLSEMDVNPVIVLPQGQGVLALDAMIACDPAP